MMEIIDPLVVCKLCGWDFFNSNFHARREVENEGEYEITFCLGNESFGSWNGIMKGKMYRLCTLYELTFPF